MQRETDMIVQAIAAAVVLSNMQIVTSRVNHMRRIIAAAETLTNVQIRNSVQLICGIDKDSLCQLASCLKI